MANLLKGRKASHKASYEGFDLSHYSNFTSAVGHILPIHWDFLLPDDKVNISTTMKTLMQPLNSASPLTIREHVDYYFVPLECLYSLFPSLLSNTNEDASSSLFDSSQFRDAFPLVDFGAAKHDISTTEDYKDRYYFDTVLSGANRLIEFFEYGGKIYNENSTPQTSQNLNALLLQAYHAVWEYFFRDDKRVEFDSSRFNFDKYYATMQASVSELISKDFFSLEYRPLKKDPYTIVSPSPLGGKLSKNSFDKSGADFASYVKQWLVGSLRDDDGTLFDSQIPLVRKGDSHYADGNYTDVGFASTHYQGDDVASVENAASIRLDQQSLQQHRIAQAIEKLSAIWMQSGKSYKEQMENLFGAKHIRTPLDKPIYIGSDINEININAEIANVTTGTGSGDDFKSYTDAGSYVGRGYGENKPNKNSFTAPCHGILLALYAAVPDAIYRQDVINVFNTYNKRNSFPNPVTDELGEQPLFGFELNSFNLTKLNTNFVGWLPRFHELKLKTNRAYGSFRRTLSYWLPTIAYETATALTSWYQFYTNPSMLDNIMLHSYRNYQDETFATLGPHYDFFDTDPLLHFFRINCTKASKMSSFGVPDTYFG